jgi:hypothetical protein
VIEVKILQAARFEENHRAAGHARAKHVSPFMGAPIMCAVLPQEFTFQFSFRASLGWRPVSASQRRRVVAMANALDPESNTISPPRCR